MTDLERTSKMLEIAIVALHKVANPIGSAVKYMEPETQLEENWRYIVTSPDYIRAVAADALHKIATYEPDPAPLPEDHAQEEAQ